ncbi:MAG: hypothetical protein KDC93_13445 [Cyclobacteriaceae bacterium]|jgi:hypothetical protein|nr:hypothetical protein [Cyclobacteriaceae bacterium]
MNKGWLYLFVLSIVALSCDTASNIEPPEDSFFLKYYGNEGNQEGVDAVVNTDGTITLLGMTDEIDFGKQLYLVNIQPNGLINWERRYGDARNEIAKDLIITSDNRLALVADIENSPTEHDILVLTLSLDGGIIASDTIKFDNGGTPTDETANSITQISDGFIVAGSTSKLDLKPTIPGGNAGDTRDALHVRLYDDLSEYPSTWRKGTGPGTYDDGLKVIEVGTNQFYFFGTSDTPNRDGDLSFYVLSLGATGEAISASDFLPGQLQGANEILSSVITSPVQSGEGYLLAGLSQSGSDADVLIVKLRKDLNFGNSDIQFTRTLGKNLGAVDNGNVSVFASKASGFLVLTNDKSEGNQNFYLMKVDNSGFPEWNDPIIFGGELDDRIGAVLELPDGSIGIIGTFAIGRDGETKMTFIKVNKEGKFLE